MALSICRFAFNSAIVKFCQFSVPNRVYISTICKMDDSLFASVNFTPKKYANLIWRIVKLSFFTKTNGFRSIPNFKIFANHFFFRSFALILYPEMETHKKQMILICCQFVLIGLLWIVCVLVDLLFDWTMEERESLVGPVSGCALASSLHVQSVSAFMCVLCRVVW